MLYGKAMRIASNVSAYSISKMKWCTVVHNKRYFLQRTTIENRKASIWRSLLANQKFKGYHPIKQMCFFRNIKAIFNETKSGKWIWNWIMLSILHIHVVQKSGRLFQAQQCPYPFSRDTCEHVSPMSSIDKQSSACIRIFFLKNKVPLETIL